MDIFASGNRNSIGLSSEWFEQPIRWISSISSRDQMVTVLRNERKEKDYFIDTIKTVRNEINNCLQIAKPLDIPPMKESLIDAANYTLEGDGKRLRPILTWVMAVNEYGLQASAIVPR